MSILEMGLVRKIAQWGEKIVISDYDEFGAKPKARRALLSYLVLPLLPPPAFRDQVKFSNRGIAQEIARGLNELGYAVDIVHFTNRSWKPQKHYDLFIGHGGQNFGVLSKLLAKKTPRIYFATGLYWRELNIRIAKRIFDLTRRRGFLLPGYRSLINDEEFANQVAGGIICLGNKSATETYVHFPNVIGINNAIFPLGWDGWRNKNYDTGRKHFLFFSGRGNIVKGLDLVLEAFAKTELHLHICQHLEPDFAQIYKHELTQCPNIHVHGFVNMRSPKFEELATLCNWVISATCGEGQPGAILECMGYGLIPILPHSANIDLESWGINLPNCDVETIRSIVLESSTLSLEKCREMAASVAKTTRQTYSTENFREGFKNAVNCILKPPQGV